MSNKFSEIPDLPSHRYPERISVPVSKEAKELYRKLKESGKDNAEFVRNVVERELRAAFAAKAS